MIFATAGHVDHGKTTLIQAITGVNTTHLPEEKKRGMTIDLGYAYWRQDDGTSIGFVDVPGHEKFLSNMLAGVGGISHALLIVACDDGVMTQTIEHISILHLAGCPQVTVILTKADRVTSARIEEVRAQTTDVLANLGWQHPDIFVTSAPSGEGIPALRDYLVELHQQEQQHPQWHKRFRLAIDRVFSIKGAGLVVTGTALAGQISVGDTFWLTGADKPARIRALHAQNHPVESAGAGHRIAINITGDVSKENVSRGDWLLSQKPNYQAHKVLVSLIADEPLKHWQPVHIHHGTRHITGRVALLNEANDTPQLAELILDEPLWLVDNDRLILRDISAQRTLAAAKVLHLHSPRRGKRQREFLTWLHQLDKADSARANLALCLPKGELSLNQFAWAQQLTENALEQLLETFELVNVAGIILSKNNADNAKQKLLNTLEEYHQQHNDQMGVGRSRLKRMALPTYHDELVYHLIEQLRKEGAISQSRGWLHLPTHGLAFSSEQESLWQHAKVYFEQSEPWWVRDLANEMKIDEKEIRSLLRKAAQLGLIIPIIADRYYTHTSIEKFASIIVKYNENNGSVTAADFRDELSVGRKLAVQILEYFDRTGFTRRKKDLHILRDKGLF
ncbi:MAG TPA: selenocysteinyl-tRNA-specific translation elongation factor SelB [Proteus vulgaris]|jgi:selenocysteine-specific elongation factor|uniref:selenocysteine-specific translation elongation factor n=1 Tax=Proteus TaxID=583 RepID=UPI000C9EE9AF|nr:MULTISPECIES: selenocysteine-specific translation elongation factor [Proteus]NBN58739.1 selenocysteine-specific translation elongation factor [Proteus sp. G2639]AYY82480.1 selenocysteinyl-tRNA-specific translation elongation factor SelB [Proteus vulgaris]MBG5970417.1 selenocysteine-specific translation elongation factor [Proteus vulgaris]MBW3472388.1 selenocysteine-specific translation elongation factor [Proteus vulgaris]MCH4256304.1 selenocysteine-specific translation elongation factor [Pr